MKEKKADKFLHFLIAFSCEINLWVTLGEFAVKKRKIWKENLYLTEDWLGRNEIWYAEDNHSYMCHIWAEGFLDLNFY